MTDPRTRRGTPAGWLGKPPAAWLGWIGAAALLLALPAAAAPIDSQPTLSGDGEVAVLKARVGGDVLTVVLTWRNRSDRDRLDVEVDRLLRETHYIVKEQAKKYHVLKDDKGEFLAGVPASLNSLEIEPGAAKTTWFKFPAPPADVEAIDLSVYDVVPFDDLPLAR